VAMMLTMALPFALSWLMQAKERRQRFLYATVVVLLVGGAVATQKKTSMVGPSVCILVLLLYRPRQMLRLAPLAVVVLGVVHFIAPGALGDVFDQLLPSQVGKVNTTQDRVSDYEAVRPDLVSHPLLGRGYESYDQKKYRILDNQYLTTIIGVGILGIASYLTIFFSILLLAHRLARSKDPEQASRGMAAAAAIASLVVGSMLLDVFALPQLPYLIVFIGGLVVVSSQRAHELEPPAPPPEPDPPAASPPAEPPPEPMLVWRPPPVQAGGPRVRWIED